MTEDSPRQALLDLPVAPTPPELTARLRVIASHERRRRLHRHRWLERVWLESNDLLKPLAVPAFGGLLSSVLLFSFLMNTLNVQQYLSKDIPLGIYTQVSVDELSPFGGSGGDVIVEVTIDRTGRVSDYSLPNGKVSEDQLRQIGNLILFSTFRPATAYGQPVSGKILVALHHINIRG
jgi:hypothetical protein